MVVLRLQSSFFALIGNAAAHLGRIERYRRASVPNGLAVSAGLACRWPSKEPSD